MAKLVDLGHKWATLLGRVLIAFGAIEGLTHDCLKEWLSDPIYDHLKNTRLSKRIELVIDLVQAKGFEKENTEGFVFLWQKAKELAKKRNIIAHNPLILSLFYGDPDFHEVIQSPIKDNVFITFENLETITIESETLAEELINAKVKFRLEGWEASLPQQP